MPQRFTQPREACNTPDVTSSIELEPRRRHCGKPQHATLGCGAAGLLAAADTLRHSRTLPRSPKPSRSSDPQGQPTPKHPSPAYTDSSSSSLSMLTEAGHKQPDQASPYLRNSSDDSTDVATLLFPVNFLEPTTPETFLELDPAGFITYSSSSSGATKGSCASSSFGRAAKTQPDCWAKLEPSREPCTDEIPWPDLVFWLGNVSTGEVVCSCAQCSSGHRAMRQRQRRYSPYEQQMQMQIQMQQQHRRRVSSRVPVINLPRIEGVN